MNDIDWTPHDQYSEDTVTCKCGAVFRSHCKFVVMKICSRKPCPGCGKNNDVVRARSDPEYMEIKKGP